MSKFQKWDQYLKATAFFSPIALIKTICLYVHCLDPMVL